MSLYPASSDYTVTPGEVASADDRPRDPVCGCCSDPNYARADGEYEVRGLVQLHHESSRMAGPRASDGRWWRAAISIDQLQSLVQVKVRIGAVNATGRTDDYPGTRALATAAFVSEMQAIKSAIERAWNTPYWLVVVDDECGRQRFRVNYVVEFTRPDGPPAHYTIDFINVPTPPTPTAGSVRSPLDPWRREVWRSGMRISKWEWEWAGKLNLGENNSASSFGTGRDGVWTMEAHEFGHMLGLLDEYEDVDKDIGGIRYTFFDRRTEFAGNTDNPHLMGQSGEKWRAEPARYTIPLQNAVEDILKGKGRTVIDISTEGPTPT